MTVLLPDDSSTPQTWRNVIRTWRRSRSATRSSVGRSGGTRSGSLRHQVGERNPKSYEAVALAIGTSDEARGRRP
ncbi:hypothetical protein BX266_7019 [Streptomyces sp. TLI_171]|nr:hypothetical protein BX266_7019 [Streptomyces sp. TLI_171]